jgi:hypothetical protein
MDERNVAFDSAAITAHLGRGESRRTIADTGCLSGHVAGIRASSSSVEEVCHMWPTKTGDKLTRVGASMGNVGSRAVQFLRADYPDSFPRQGFIAAVALLPQRTPSQGR